MVREVDPPEPALLELARDAPSTRTLPSSVHPVASSPRQRSAGSPEERLPRAAAQRLRELNEHGRDPLRAALLPDIFTMTKRGTDLASAMPEPAACTAAPASAPTADVDPAQVERAMFDLLLTRDYQGEFGMVATETTYADMSTFPSAAHVRELAQWVTKEVAGGFAAARTRVSCAADQEPLLPSCMPQVLTQVLEYRPL